MLRGQRKTKIKRVPQRTDENGRSAERLNRLRSAVSVCLSVRTTKIRGNACYTLLSDRRDCNPSECQFHAYFGSRDSGSATGQGILKVVICWKLVALRDCIPDRTGCR